MTTDIQAAYDALGPNHQRSVMKYAAQLLAVQDRTPRAERPHYVYRIYDAADQLLYVGFTECVETRLSLHTAWSTPGEVSWGIQRNMARHTSEEHPTKAAAHAAEILASQTEMPLLNKQHNPGRFTRVRGLGYVPVAVPA